MNSNKSPAGHQKDTFNLTMFNDSPDPEKNEAAKMRLNAAVANFNNKSVEILKAKFHPNANVSKETLKKFFAGSPGKMNRKASATVEGVRDDQSPRVGNVRFLTSADGNAEGAPLKSVRNVVKNSFLQQQEEL